MNEDMSDLPQAIAADPDGVQVALRAAHTLWSRGDTAESLKWLRKAAESASDEGADVRSLQLAKAAAELRARLVGGSEPPARSALAGAALSGAALSGAAANAAVQQTASFPPGDAAPGESGSHPIAPSRARSGSEPPREGFAGAASAEETSGALSSRPVTATQYPSPRPRQRIGLLSASPASTRDSGAYASVPSWSADSERRGSGAPPPLPAAILDDYEELEAEPDDEPADDPGSVWSSGGPESWRPAEARGISSGATPPPLPTGGAFADDDNEFTQQTEAQTGALPPLQEDPGAEPRSTREPRHAVAAFGLQGNAWDQQARVPSWEHGNGSPWGTEAHAPTWGSAHSPDSTHPQDGASPQELLPEGAPSETSETSRAKLTARVHHQAVRVSFAPDLRVPGQYLVRPLREGEKAATGERVALLVALEPGVPLV